MEKYTGLKTFNKIFRESNHNFKKLGYPEIFRESKFEENFYAYITWAMYIMESYQVLDSIELEPQLILSDLEKELAQTLVSYPNLPEKISKYVFETIYELKSILKDYQGFVM